MTGLSASMNSPFIRFVLTGGLAAGVNIGARVLLSLVMPFEVAVVIAYLCGMTTAYILARRFVFARSGQSMRSEFLRFTAVNGISLAQVWLISVGLANWFFPLIGFIWHAEFIAHAIGVVSPVLTSYFLHKLFTFRQIRPAMDPADVGRRLD